MSKEDAKECIRIAVKVMKKIDEAMKIK
ncbi:hypothetical protein [Caldicoprobacter guelmensis]